MKKSLIATTGSVNVVFHWSFKSESTGVTTVTYFDDKMFEKIRNKRFSLRFLKEHVHYMLLPLSLPALCAAALLPEKKQGKYTH